MVYPLPNDNIITLYTKNNCRYCIAAKNLLIKNNIKHEIINCDNFLLENRDKLVDFLTKTAKIEIKTFPVIFYNKNYIGGYTELKEKHDKTPEVFIHSSVDVLDFDSIF